MEKINDKIKSSNDLNLYTELSFISRELEQELKETENGNKFMDSFRTLLENFHSYLTKNSQLVEVIQQYNQTMFANAQKLKQISTQASYDKDEIASLTQEFERIVKIMEQAKKQTDSTSLSIRSYQEEIDFYLKKQTEEIERDKEKGNFQTSQRRMSLLKVNIKRAKTFIRSLDRKIWILYQLFQMFRCK